MSIVCCNRASPFDPLTLLTGNIHWWTFTVVLITLLVTLNIDLCFTVPYTRSSAAACRVPNNHQYQGRWSFCCGLSQLSPDGGFCCWSTSLHRSPLQSLTWTLSCSKWRSWKDDKCNIGKEQIYHIYHVKLKRYYSWLRGLNLHLVAVYWNYQYEAQLRYSLLTFSQNL